MRNNLNKSAVKFIDDEDQHLYLDPNGVEIQGLTTLLKKHSLSPDYRTIPESVLRRAAERGTAIHNECQMWDECRFEPESLDAMAYVSLNLDAIANEFLVSYKTIVATQIDVILRDYSVCDIKTTSKIHFESVSWQCSIGAYLLEKQCGIKVPHVYVIHLRDGRANMVELDRISDEKIACLFEAEERGEVLLPEPSEQKYELAKNVQSEVSKLLIEQKIIDDKIKKLRVFLTDEMGNNGVKSIKCDGFSVTYTNGGKKKTFDAKQCVEDNPSMKKYYKESESKASVTIKIQ